MSAPRAHHGRRALWAVILLVVLTALLALAAQPTGAETPEATVPSDARVSVRRDVAGVAVLLTVRRGELALVVAHHEGKGWFAVSVDPVPRSVETTWSATRGGSGVPALAAAYGRADAGTVRVTWDDRASDTVTVGSDGLWLAVHRGAVHVTRVERIAVNGTVTATEAGP